MPIRFALGIWITEYVFAIGHIVGSIATYLALVVDLGIIWAIALLGLYATRYKVWAFKSLVAFISLDTILFIIFAGPTQILGVLVHILAIYSIYSGIKAAKIYAERMKNGQV